ncbi:MAG: glycosyl transferase family 1 [Cellvibrionales bacterium]|nr:glycosyl transferase family 1 [Cellvibrionales bacterium]
MKILLLSAYDAQSHRYWRESLVDQFEQYQWTVLSLPPRFFSYRVRANPMTWFIEQRPILSADYDLIIATSMVDVATLKGLIPSLATTPLWLYCHENQFSYPLSHHLDDRALNNLDAKMVFVYNCLAAKQISFNSEFNRRTAIDGLQALLKKFPEKIPISFVDEIMAKTSVLAVPLQTVDAASQSLMTQQVDKKKAIKIVWNHRWEYDKGPDILLAIVEQLAAAGQAIEFNIVGQQFRQSPAAFSAIKQAIERSATIKLGRWGFVQSITDYQQLLTECDVVLSTALHDFQGLSVLEAVQAGCIPLLPDHLVYPEIFSSIYLYPCGGEPKAIAKEVLERLCLWRRQKQWPPLPDIRHFDWSQLREQYLAHIKSH